MASALRLLFCWHLASVQIGLLSRDPWGWWMPIRGLVWNMWLKEGLVSAGGGGNCCRIYKWSEFVKCLQDCIHHHQGSFWVWAQPMRDDVAYVTSSLTGWAHTQNDPDHILLSKNYAIYHISMNVRMKFFGWLLQYGPIIGWFCKLFARNTYLKACLWVWDMGCHM